MKKAIIKIHPIFDRFWNLFPFELYTYTDRTIHMVLQNCLIAIDKAVKVFNCNIVLAINRSIFAYVRESIYLIIKVVNRLKRKVL